MAEDDQRSERGAEDQRPERLAGTHDHVALRRGGQLAQNGTWDVILGDPANGFLPSDPLMLESTATRIGTNPVTGDALVGIGPNDPTQPINGKEYTITAKDDLQYACVFGLGSCNTAADCGDSGLQCIGNRCARDCSDPNLPACDCASAANDNPLCFDGGAFGQVQYAAKAYPGVRELAVIRALGGQGVAASICPAQTMDAGAPDFGYVQAVRGVVDAMRPLLPRRVSGQCLPRGLVTTADGQVACFVVEAKQLPDQCVRPGRMPVRSGYGAVVDRIAQEPNNPGWQEYCEIVQLAGAALDRCQNDPTDDPAADGFCYVDPGAAPPVGSDAVVASCPATEKRLLRFVGEATDPAGASLFLACAGDPSG